jgi:hypothetical protein
MIHRLLPIVTINMISGFSFLPKSKRKKIEEKNAEEEFKNNILCRFVLDGVGVKIGESVAIDDDILIIKSGTKYLGVPLKHIEIEEKTLLVKGLIEKDNAEIMGEKWRQESFKKIDDKKDGEKNGF